jgi:2-dehydro-3-deoxyphosphogluconate aldolase/(4S)-4-hydroxy-2-oxoglutarate aldolase
MSWLRDHLREHRVVAIVRADTIADPRGLVGTLVDAGVVNVEFTYTTPDVLAIVERTASVDGATVGVGTVLTPQQAVDATNAGARFVVTPVRDLAVETACHAAGVPIIPGAMTPTEIHGAATGGASVVKVFPARSLGPSYIADVLAPLPGLALVPSGGIGIDDAADYLRAGAWAVGLGSLVPAAALVSGDHTEVRVRADRVMRSIVDVAGRPA